MKRLIYIFLPVLLLAGCGVSRSVPYEEEEVDIGYGSMKRKDITSSVSSLQVDQKEVTTYSNMYDYLRGRVPGVQVTSDNKILIRGVNSINLSTDPLIILDGSEINDLSVINPNDVDSVTVLKDGSASIYGVRGANGVIIITTRR
jgi:TonB-dependent SusC/RagA subfamily outer membrane receptor